MENKLTKRQQQVLDFIRQFIIANLKPPTVREIGAHFGAKSSNAAMCLLNALSLKGYITLAHGESRSVMPRSGVNCPCCGHDLATRAGRNLKND